MSLVNTLFLNQYWTTWKPERGVLMLELSFTLPQYAFCAFLHVGQTVCVTVPAGVVGLLHTQGAQMTSRSPCKYPELRYQTRGKSANVGWDAPINESQTPGVRITIGKGIKELGWSIHEMIAVSHSVWCHTTFNHFCVFHKVLVHHSTTVMWNGDS